MENPNLEFEIYYPFECMATYFFSKNVDDSPHFNRKLHAISFAFKRGLALALNDPDLAKRILAGGNYTSIYDTPSKVVDSDMRNVMYRWEKACEETVRHCEHDVNPALRIAAAIHEEFVRG